MHDFTAASWILTLTTTTLLLAAVWHRRSLVVKPSIAVIFFYHLSIQWPAAVKAAEIARYLPRPYDFLWLAHGFPLAGLFGSYVFGRPAATATYRRLVKPRAVPARRRRRAIVLLGCAAAAILAFYFSQVPPTATGLYALLADPARSTTARENSLKLLDSPLLQYLFHFMASAFAPLLAVLLVEDFVPAVRSRRAARSAVYITALVALLVAVSITGARSFAAILIVTVIVAIMLRRGMPMNPGRLGIAVVAVVAVPAALTFMREGAELNAANVLTYFQAVLFDRILVGPMQTGLNYVHYAQTHGYLGVGAVGKLATLLGVTPVNAPNIIGLAYETTRVTSVHADACYVLSYYSYFGLVSLPFSVFGLWLLDAVLLLYRRLSATMLLACVATVLSASIAFISTDYTTVLVTHGFAVTLVAAFLLDRAARVSFAGAGARHVAPDGPSAARRPLRVCHLTSVHPWNDVRICVKECRTLAAAGYDTHFVVPGEAGEPGAGITVHQVPKLPGRLRRFTRTVRAVYRCARDLDADIYHFHDPDLLPAGLLLQRRGHTVVYDVHEDVPLSLTSRGYLPRRFAGVVAWLVARVEASVARRLSGIVAATPTLGARFHRINPNTVVVNNYPLAEEFAAGRPWTERRKAVAYAGPLCRERGIIAMVDAIARVDPALDVTLDLAGAFSPADERRFAESRAGWARVHELGVLNRTGVADLLASVRAGLVVLRPHPRFVVAQPVKLFEYMAAGLPVVASDFPLWREWIEGAGCGLLVDPDDAGAIASAIEFLVAHPAEAEAMGRQGREAFETLYNWSHEAATLVSFYRSLVPPQQACASG